MFASRRIFNLVLVLAVAGFAVAGYVAIGPPSAPKATSTTQTVTKGSVLSSVSATGNASASRQLSLNFQSSGTITEVDVAVGQHVDVGQILGKITNASQQASLMSSQASLASAQAKLALDRQGETAAQRAVDDVASLAAAQSVNSAVANIANAQSAAATDAVTQQSGLGQAQQALTNAQNTAALDAKQQADNLAAAQQAVQSANSTAATDTAQQAANVNAAEQAVVNAQNNANQDATQQQHNYDAAVTKQSDDSTATQCSSPGGTPPTTVCSSESQSQRDSDAQAVQNASDQKQAAALKDQQAIQQAQTGVTNAQNAQTAAAVKDQQAIQQAETAVTNAQNAQAASALKDQQALVSAQQAITNAQNTQQSGQLKDQQSVQSAQQQLATAQISQQSTAANNAVKQAPPTDATLAADQATVDNAMAQLDTSQTNFNQTVLTAPVAGTVAALNGQVGAQSGSSSSGSSSSSSSSSTASSSSTSSAGSAGSGFVTLTDLTSLQVVAGFSESDAAKVQLGQAATVTFNALPNQNLQGKVSEIDVNSQTVSNVVTYNVTVSIVNPPASLKPGMTANVAVTTAARDGVLTLPSSAVSGSGTTTTLQVQGATGKPQTRVVTIGLRGDTNLEITSGLNVGDKVIVTRTATTGGAARTGTGAGAGAILGGGGGFIPGGGGGGGALRGG